MPAPTGPSDPGLNATPPPVDGDVARLQRTGSWMLTATALLYLVAAGVTTYITWRLRYEDWFLYALMSLCTATVVTNYSILRPRAPVWVRWTVFGFAELVIAAWSLLLFERTQVGWVIVEGEAVNHGAQTWFYAPVAVNVICALLLAAHVVLIAPKLRRSALLEA